LPSIKPVTPLAPPTSSASSDRITNIEIESRHFFFFGYNLPIFTSDNNYKKPLQNKKQQGKNQETQLFLFFNFSLSSSFYPYIDKNEKMKN